MEQKHKKLVAGSIVLLGIVYSLYNATTDYGLRSNTLHKCIAAQSDDTSGGTGGGSCDGNIILCKSYLHREIKTLTCTANNEGTLNILGLSLGGYKCNTTYTVNVVDYSCRPNSSDKNVCDTRKQKTELLSLSEGVSTNGNTTN